MCIAAVVVMIVKVTELTVLFWETLWAWETIIIQRAW